jgi:hypothetical protein
MDMGDARVRGTKGGTSGEGWGKALVLLCLVVAGGAFARTSGGAVPQTDPETRPSLKEHLDLPVSVEGPVAPTPVKGTDGRTYLLYHLFVTNWSFSDLTVTSVEVRAGRGGAVLAAYGPADLEQWHRFRAVLPTPAPLKVSRPADLRRIASGRTAVLFADFALDGSEVLPPVLMHRFAFEASPPIKLRREDPRDEKGEHVLEEVAVAVSRMRPVVLGPPLRGGPWKCSGTTDPSSLHQHQTTLVLR